MDGVLTCARYAFAPNYYKYCGPDENKNIAAYLEEGVSDPGLTAYLTEFAVLYPYLKLIAQENNISDPFDLRVVEAYWVGNELLDKIRVKSLADHLLYEQRLKDRIPPKKLKWIIDKVPNKAKIHHSFHVFSIFTRTGHHAVEHTLNTMDQCRIGWGKVAEGIKKQKTSVKVESQQLVYENGKLRLINNVVKEIALPLMNYKEVIKKGDWITYHWGFICAKINRRQVAYLERFTEHNLSLANLTI